MGLFISFEGGEGSGKSTQAERLARRLRAHHCQVLLTYEPGGTALGNELRDLLKSNPRVALSAGAELLLFAAARSQLTQEVILPALDQGVCVICDRYMDSTTAYQGYGRGLPLDTVETVNRFATHGLQPDLVFLLDMQPDESLERKRLPRDRIEDEGSSFHKRVRAGYLEMAAREPKRWLVVDAALQPDEVEQRIWSRIEPLLQRQRSNPPS